MISLSVYASAMMQLLTGLQMGLPKRILRSDHY
jgi:hypothetical protein